MTQIKKLSDIDLLSEVKSLVGNERNLLIKILQYLREIESRKLYLERGYSSLFSFCVEYLGYEESQAQRRISAMRLMREIPEVERKIENGSLSLTAVTQAQSYFRKEASTAKPMTASQKKEILSLLENKSTRECERALIKLNPEFLPTKPEKTRALTEDLSEVRVILKNETLDKLKKLKNLLSNKYTNMTLQDLIGHLADEGLKKFDPEQKAQSKKQASKINAHSAPASNSKTNVKMPANKNFCRYIPTNLRRQVWSRDKGKCVYTDSLTGKRCDSQFKLHLDHKKPWAAGGEHTLENLRVLCAQHNNLQAVHFYGKEKMRPYLGAN